MMDTQSNEDTLIPINAQVHCTDGACGHSTCVLVNPITNKVTHLVVKDASPPHTEFIVPVTAVITASTELIQLQCSAGELRHMDPLVRTEFVEKQSPNDLPSNYGATVFSYGIGSYLYWPFVAPLEFEKVEHQQIPPGELAIRRGTTVQATDGPVGHVDEFLIHPDTGNITHLVMREGHLWAQKDVSIPVSAICETHDQTVFLTLDKQQVESLPTIPIHRPVV